MLTIQKMRPLVNKRNPKPADDTNENKETMVEINICIMLLDPSTVTLGHTMQIETADPPVCQRNKITPSFMMPCPGFACDQIFLVELQYCIHTLKAVFPFTSWAQQSGDRMMQ